MTVNVAKHRIPVGTLIELNPELIPWNGTGDTKGIVLAHRKPIYLTVLIGDQKHEFDFNAYTDLTGCWVNDITILKCPDGRKTLGIKDEWYPGRFE
jgi:hypothetical protein